MLAAGGLPLEFPTISLGEPFLHPTSLMFRNLMSMDVEEMIRAQPMDAVVLIGGCDKTVPAQLMGALSADMPAILVVTGPMMTSRHGDQRLGACTDCRRFWAQYRAGDDRRRGIARDRDPARDHRRHLHGDGHRQHDGLPRRGARHDAARHRRDPGGARRPAARRRGERARARCAGAGDGPRPSEIITPAAVENALRVLLAIGGSTNGIIHLAAIAGRPASRSTSTGSTRCPTTTPVLVDLKPTGPHYMEDFFAAGGLGAVLRELQPLLHLERATVTGQTLGRAPRRASRRYVDRSVVRPFAEPISRGRRAGRAVRLAGAGRRDPQALGGRRRALFEHEGRAVVFASLDDLSARIDDPELDVTADDVLVLQNAGPEERPGMPEAGYLPIPGKLARAGVKDMVRISDARMSGTAFGTIVLHVTPEAAAGGPLGLRAQRRPHPAQRRGAAARPAGRRGRARAPGSRGRRRRADRRARLPALYHDHVLRRRPRLRLRLPPGLSGRSGAWR